MFAVFTMICTGLCGHLNNVYLSIPVHHVGYNYDVYFKYGFKHKIDKHMISKITVFKTFSSYKAM